jgi:hypothetical protein
VSHRSLLIVSGSCKGSQGSSRAAADGSVCTAGQGAAEELQQLFEGKDPVSPAEALAAVLDA